MVMMAMATGTPQGGTPLKMEILGTPACESHDRIKPLGRNQELKDAHPDEETP